MSLLNLPTIQLVLIWGELLEAYYGVNGYGGNVAEIYAYRMHGHSPTLDLVGHYGEEARKLTARESAAALRELIGIFRGLYDCKSVKINGKTVKCFTFFDHRCHVEIIKTKGETK